MNKKRTTLKDISFKTGFSVKTVSRAINQQGEISEETRKKILDTAKEMDYYPNLIAKGLRKNETYTIGYIVHDINNEFYGNVGIAIEKEFKKYGYNTLITFTEDNPDTEIQALKLFVSKRVDGIILSSCGLTKNYVKNIIDKIPLVVIDNEINGLKTNLLITDNLNGSYLLTKHLIQNGHTDIACITGPLYRTCGITRLSGYKKALSEFNIKEKEKLIKISNWKMEGGYSSTIELIKENINCFSAIFYTNSIMALGGYKALREMNLKIPKDIAIAAFDNLEFVEALNPPLTTLSEVGKNMGEAAAKFLYKSILNKEITNYKKKIIKLRLFIRESSG